MPVYKIATKKVFIEPKGEILKSRAEKYRVREDIKKSKCDIVIDLNNEKFKEYNEKYKRYGYDALEYAYVGTDFYKALLEFDGFFLHSSVVAVDEKAYIFSADSGVGKSTHTRLWKEYFKERAEIINDDKPAIICGENSIRAYGTPFCGKNDINENKSVEVKVLCFLERGDTNEIKKIKTDEAIRRLYVQLLYSDKENEMRKLLSLLDEFLNKVEVYVLKCTISEEAVKVAYEEMSK